ncbi:hypothetical protein D1Y85_00010 [Paraburkholderia dinghuensis]|uniref:WGR domain-containing protein n=2 Tax=Paraburkholderia dinghuensis TaxID=2305225 RepID=A0A3N6NDW3_9BURK|nr:hypothetical protein D1Y85_00010 [Paraburkholderia dinghuensis]
MKGPRKISLPETYTNRRGETFEYTIHDHEIGDGRDYWLYTIQVKHETWGFRAFGVHATKQAFPTTALAEHLARTVALEAVQQRLEQATATGFPLVFPTWFDGWFVI